MKRRHGGNPVIRAPHFIWLWRYFTMPNGSGTVCWFALFQ